MQIFTEEQAEFQCLCLLRNINFSEKKVSHCTGIFIYFKIPIKEFFKTISFKLNENIIPELILPFKNK